MNQTKVKGDILLNDSGEVLASDCEITLWKGSFLADNDAGVELDDECRIRLDDGRLAEIVITDVDSDPDISATKILIHFSCFAELE